MSGSKQDINDTLRISFDSEQFRRDPVNVIKPVLGTLRKHGAVIDQQNLISMANLPLDTEAINLLYTFANENNQKFYQAILLNNKLLNFNKYDEQLLMNLAKHATKKSQFRKIFTSDTCSLKVIAAILNNPLSAEDSYDLDRLIFDKLSADNNATGILVSELPAGFLIKLATRAKIVTEFQLILSLARDSQDNAVFKAILDNKAFSLNNWYKPDFWRRSRPNSSIAGLTTQEKLQIIPHIKDTVLLEKIAENIGDLTPGISIPDNLSSEEKQRKQQEQNRISQENENKIRLAEAVANNGSSLNKRIAKHILNNEEVVKGLSTAALNNLAQHATTSEQFKSILNADNANASTVNIVLKTAKEVNFSGWRGLGRKIFSSAPRKMLRAMGNFFNKALGINQASSGGVRVPNVTVGSLIETIFDDNNKTKFALTDMTPESRKILSRAITNAAQKPDKHDDYIAEINNAAVVGMPKQKPVSQQALDSAPVSPTLQSVQSVNVPVHLPQNTSDLAPVLAAFKGDKPLLTTWVDAFNAQQKLQTSLELKDNRCVFKSQQFGEKEATAFIDAIILMEQNSATKPLAIDINNFTPEFITTIMDKLDEMKQQGPTVPNVKLQFDNFGKLSPDLQLKVKAYNQQFLPSSKSSKESTAFLDAQQQMAEQLAALTKKMTALQNTLLPIIQSSSSGLVLLLGINAQNKEKYESAILEHCTEMYHYWRTNQERDVSQRTIALTCFEDTKEHIDGILAIVQFLASMKETNPQLNMQIEFKDQTGKPITEQTFQKVGMSGQQWTDFAAQIKAITTVPQSPGAQLIANPNPNHNKPNG